jgi:hypothetical protein
MPMTLLMVYAQAHVVLLLLFSDFLDEVEEGERGETGMGLGRRCFWKKHWTSGVNQMIWRREKDSYPLGLIFSNSKECAMWIEKKEKGRAEGVALYRVAIHPFLTKKRKRWRHVRLTM